jgi:lysyl-tRNA synthetase class 2
MNYHDMMDFTEEMITTVAHEVCGTLELPYGEHTVSLKRPWARLTMRDALIQIGGAKPDELETLDSLKALSAKHKVHLKAHMDYGHAFTELFEALCETKLINPTFIYDYPKAVSPLARSHDNRPEWAQRSEFFIVGREHGNLFSELNDPAEQAARFAEQVAQAQKGDDEAMPYDHDYIRALEYGLLPTAGLGVGIDRLVMLLTNQPSIREVILFPTLRPE